MNVNVYYEVVLRGRRLKVKLGIPVVSQLVAHSPSSALSAVNG